jgi:hypothetical protein
MSFMAVFPNFSFLKDYGDELQFAKITIDGAGGSQSIACDCLCTRSAATRRQCLRLPTTELPAGGSR